jgi:2-polyprenyl-3-methyl-5-hydroxy-6-metoxy-1,4-benzoquinol methylase
MPRDSTPWYCRGPIVMADDAFAVLSEGAKVARRRGVADGSRPAWRSNAKIQIHLMRTNDSVQKLYTDRGALYQRLFVDFLGWGRELETFFRRADYLRPHLKILDAGCGTGIITRVLYQLAQEQGHAGIQFHAFDLTPKVLEIFRQWISAQGANQIELVQADVLETGDLPAHWKEYDLIVSSTMLEICPEIRRSQRTYSNCSAVAASFSSS